MRTPELAANFRGACDATLDSWLEASDVDVPAPEAEAVAEAEGRLHAGNPSKWILWSDPLLDLADLAAVHATRTHYERLAARLDERAAGGAPGDRRLGFVAELSRVLAVKCALHEALRPAYRDKDVDAIADLVTSVIPALAEGVDRLRKAHRDRWHKVNKTFGWEVIERRYGGLSARLGTLRDVLTTWLEDPAQPIEALEVDQLPLFGSGALGRSLRHDTVATACLRN
jgi:hexosaminidase